MERIELGGVHIYKVLEPDGTITLEWTTDDISQWEVIGMLQVTLQWELGGYPPGDDDDE